MFLHVVSGSGVEHRTITDTLFFGSGFLESSSSFLIEITFANALSRSWLGFSRKDSSASRDSLVLFRIVMDFLILSASL